MRKFVIKLLLVIFLILPFVVKAEEKNINMYLFYGSTCPHCEHEIEFLSEYIKGKDNLKLYKFEVWDNEENKSKQKEVLNYFGESKTSVPLLVIGEKYIIGFGQGYTNKNIINLINYYESNDYKDVVGDIVGVDIPSNLASDKDYEVVDSYNNEKYNVPVLGEINLKDISLPILAAIIGFVDGVNPCAMWILLFLITILFGMKDKKKMLIIGLTFIVSSGVVYALFMVSYLNIASYLNSVKLFRIGVGALALLFGGYNIIKFIKTKDVGCTVVDDKKRNKIMTSVKKIVSSNYFIVAILGIIILAFVVNVIELACSLGLPVMFTQIMSLNDLNSFEKFINIFIYILFFVLDDMLVFFIAYKTSKLSVLGNKFSKYTHLIGGIIMLLIGILMIWLPGILMFNF